MLNKINNTRLKKIYVVSSVFNCVFQRTYILLPPFLPYKTGFLNKYFHRFLDPIFTNCSAPLKITDYTRMLNFTNLNYHHVFPKILCDTISHDNMLILFK